MAITLTQYAEYYGREMVNTGGGCMVVEYVVETPDLPGRITVEVDETDMPRGTLRIMVRHDDGMGVCECDDGAGVGDAITVSTDVYDAGAMVGAMLDTARERVAAAHLDIEQCDVCGRSAFDGGALPNHPYVTVCGETCASIAYDRLAADGAADLQ